MKKVVIRRSMEYTIGKNRTHFYAYHGKLKPISWMPWGNLIANGYEPIRLPEDMANELIEKFANMERNRYIYETDSRR